MKNNSPLSHPAPPPRKFRLNRRKLEALVIYFIAGQREHLKHIRKRKRFSRRMTFAKLCALLFFTDIESYKVTGKPISGATYIKEEFGCYPLGLREVLDKLAKQGRIRGWRGEGESSDE